MFGYTPLFYTLPRHTIAFCQNQYLLFLFQVGLMFVIRQKRRTSGSKWTNGTLGSSSSLNITAPPLFSLDAQQCAHIWAISRHIQRTNSRFWLKTGRTLGQRSDNFRPESCARQVTTRGSVGNMGPLRTNRTGSIVLYGRRCGYTGLLAQVWQEMRVHRAPRSRMSGDRGAVPPWDTASCRHITF